MAEKPQQLPLTSTTAPISDVEASTATTPPPPRRHTTRNFFIFLALFFIVDILILVALDLTVLRARTPEYRLNSVAVDALSFINTTTAPPSFNIRLTAQAVIKNNKNYWPYKYETGDLRFYYRGHSVGDVIVINAGAKARSTRKLNLSFNVTSSRMSGNLTMRNDLGSGVLQFTGESELRGQVEVFKINKKDKLVHLKCSLKVNLGEKVVQDLNCN